MITVEESQTLTTELEFTEGMQFDKGYISPYFVTDAEAGETVLDDPYLLITTQKISSVADLLPVLEKVVETGKSLVVIAEDVDGEALSTLVVNAIRKTFVAVAVKAPFFGDRRKAFLQDLAIVTGAQVIAPEVGLKLDQVGLDVLGTAGRVVVSKDTTTVTHGAAEQGDIDARIAQIRREIEDTDSDWDREKLQERLAKLAGGVGVIKVGAATEVELKERKHRIEDAISATRAAIEEGIVAGGGAALVHAESALDGDLGLTGDEATGVRVVRTGLAEPLRWIAANAGEEGYVVVAKVRDLPDNQGLNAATGEYGDLLEAGVVDPVKVTKAALANAASVAALVLTTQSAVVEKPRGGRTTTATGTATAPAVTCTDAGTPVSSTSTNSPAATTSRGAVSLPDVGPNGGTGQTAGGIRREVRWDAEATCRSGGLLREQGLALLGRQAAPDAVGLAGGEGPAQAVRDDRALRAHGLGAHLAPQREGPRSFSGW